MRYPAPILAPEPQHRHLLPRHVDLLPDPSPHPYVYSPDVSTSESEAGPPRPFALVEVKPSVERRSESPVVDGKHWLRMMEKLVEGAVQDEKEGRELSQNELYDYCRLGVNEVEGAFRSRAKDGFAEMEAKVDVTCRRSLPLCVPVVNWELAPSSGEGEARVDGLLPPLGRILRFLDAPQQRAFLLSPLARFTLMCFFP